MNQILNSKGEPVLLNAQEAFRADYLTNHIKNSLGFEIDVTTLTTIVKRIVEQKFFQVAPAEYMPVKVGEGSWSSQLTTYRSFSLADDFETGVINTGASNGRLAEADTAIDSLTVKVINWAKSIGWTLAELQLASKSGNWDLITSKEKARKKNWDLGIQKTAFLGSPNDANVKGLLTQTDITSNMSIITGYIKDLSAANLNTFLAAVYGAYRTNSVHTAEPTHFVIPETDYNGLASYTDATYANKTKLQAIQEMFATLTQNPNFKVLKLSYADQLNNVGTVAAGGKNRYTLLNYDEDSVRMDIPVDYTATMANSVNSYQFQNVGYGQFTGAKAYRPLEMLYFDWAE